MALPPGPRYLLTLLPIFALPSAAVYLCFALLQSSRIFDAPLWLVVPATLLARPVLFLASGYRRKRTHARNAEKLGAEIPPVVEEWSASTIQELARRASNGYPCVVMSEFTEKYGNVFRLAMLNDSLVNTSEPEHIKAILATQFESFEKGPGFINSMGTLLGTGVFNSDGDMWKFHRTMTRPFFTRERISDFEIYDRNCDVTLRSAKNRLDEGFSVDFQDLAARFTLDSAMEFLLGTNVRSLDAGLPYPPSHEALNSRAFYDHPSTAFVNALSEGQIKSVPRLNLGSGWPLREFWKDKVQQPRKIMDDFTEPLMQAALENRRAELAAGVESKGEEESLLAHLVKHTQDPIVLKDELVNLLVAGRDTTGSLLTFSMYMLTQHPEYERRLREEILDKVGAENPPTYDNMREMKYMRAFLNEVLRLYPPVPANARCSNKDVILPPTRQGRKPIYIPANTVTIYTVMIMQRRTDLWGPDALQFDPDRFLDERLNKYLVPNPFIFSPFNAGPRICLGQQFAYHEATFFLVRLLQRFTGFTLDDSLNVAPPAEWASCTDRKAAEKVFPMAHLTMYVKGGLWIRMQEIRA